MVSVVYVIMVSVVYVQCLPAQLLLNALTPPRRFVSNVVRVQPYQFWSGMSETYDRRGQAGAPMQNVCWAFAGFVLSNRYINVDIPINHHCGKRGCIPLDRKKRLCHDCLVLVLHLSILKSENHEVVQASFEYHFSYSSIFVFFTFMQTLSFLYNRRAFAPIYITPPLTTGRQERRGGRA